MICTSIQGKSFEEIIEILSKPEIQMAEIRLDLCPLSDDQISKLFSVSDKPLVATCRIESANMHTKACSDHTLRDAIGTSGEIEDDTALSLSKRKLFAAIRAGATYADLEIEAPEEYSKEFTKLCKECGTKIIRSYHNFRETPELAVLEAMAEKHLAAGADIVKIATTATAEDALRTIYKLYEIFPKGRILAFAMGEAGKASRLDCLKLGAPFTYAALSEDEETAPGQFTEADMRKIIYGNLEQAQLNNSKAGCHKRQGINDSFNPTCAPFNRIYDSIPSSKSYAQRAIIAAALAKGVSHIGICSPCRDIESAMTVAQSLGAKISIERGTFAEVPATASNKTDCSNSCIYLSIEGIGFNYGKTFADSPANASFDNHNTGSPAINDKTTSLKELYVGESGLLTRLMIPVMSAINSGNCALTGARTLVGRPLKGALETMQEFGVKLTSKMQAGENPVTVPLEIEGNLTSGSRTVSGKDGSQIISGLLMALPLCKGDSVIEATDPKSLPYLFITTGILKEFGIEVQTECISAPLPISEADSSNEPSSNNESHKTTAIRFTIKGGQSYKPVNLNIEKDWSGAANMLVAGAIYGKATLTGMNTNTLQGDSKILEILRKAGAKVNIRQNPNESKEGDEITLEECFKYCTSNNNGQNEITGTETVTTTRAPLNAFEANLEDTPDLFPTVALLAAFCTGTSRLKGVYRLVGKESNRAEAIIEMLTRMGVQARIAESSTMLIEGESLESRILGGTLPRGGLYTSSHDHRMAMALTVASLCSQTPIEIDDFECVAKSFPDFAL